MKLALIVLAVLVLGVCLTGWFGLFYLVAHTSVWQAAVSAVGMTLAATSVLARDQARNDEEL